MPGRALPVGDSKGAQCCLPLARYPDHERVNAGRGSCLAVAPALRAVGRSRHAITAVLQRIGMTASDWLMHGPFQGIQDTPGYMRFVLPVREDRPATGILRALSG
jgi:hypothetical protein